MESRKFRNLRGVSCKNTRGREGYFKIWVLLGGDSPLPIHVIYPLPLQSHSISKEIKITWICKDLTVDPTNYKLWMYLGKAMKAYW